jgi:hypothetical protein
MEIAELRWFANRSSIEAPNVLIDLLMASIFELEMNRSWHEQKSVRHTGQGRRSPRSELSSISLGVQSTSRNDPLRSQNFLQRESERQPG